MNEITKQQLLCSLNSQLEQLLFIKTGLVNGQTDQILIDNKDLFLKKTKKEVEKIKKIKNHEALILRTDAFLLIQKEELYRSE